LYKELLNNSIATISLAAPPSSPWSNRQLPTSIFLFGHLPPEPFITVSVCFVMQVNNAEGIEMLDRLSSHHFNAKFSAPIRDSATLLEVIIDAYGGQTTSLRTIHA